MCSVGIIEVTVSERDGFEAAARAAATKGRELGCWIIVEHGAFTQARARAAFAHGARVLLAHGGVDHVSVRSPRAAQRRLTVQLDCVLLCATALALRASRPAGR